MIKKTLFALIFLLLWSINGYGRELRGDILVTVENMRSSNGYVRARLYNSSDGFPVSAEKSMITQRVKLSGKQVEILFKDLPYGDYAVGVLHDENGNGKMDMKWWGYPLEGIGASRNPEPGLLPPSFDEARLSLKSPHLHINIHMNY